MINPMLSLRKRVVAELSILLLFILLAGGYAGYEGAKSAALAGLAYLVPNTYRTIRVFRYQGARAARLILKGFYQGEMVKFALSVLLFSSVFKYCTVNPTLFFGTYIGMQMLIGFAPILIKTKGG